MNERIPRWTKYEPEGLRDTTNHEPAPARITAWCYLCGSAHRFHEACLTVAIQQRATKTCIGCGREFVPGTRRLSYCTPDCAYDAKLARKRVRERRR